MIYLTANKYSGSYSDKRINSLENELNKKFGKCRVSYTTKLNGIAGIDLDPAVILEGDTIIAAGGDGTVNACLQYIHDNSLQDKITLGIVPMGTGNNMIKSLGLKKNLTEAVRIISEGFTERISYGTVDGLRVFFNCSIGFTSFVLRNRKTNSLTGYFLDVVRLLPRYRSVKVRFAGEDQEEILAGFFINTKAYMSKFKFLKANNSGTDLKYFYIRKGSFISGMADVVKVFLDPKNYKTRTAEVYRLTLPDDANIELDGDIYSRTGTNKEIEIKNVSCVKILCNKNKR
jgi:diacylglycerol kinase family enzyme